MNNSVDSVDSAYAIEYRRPPRRVPEFVYYLAASALFAGMLLAPYWWPHLFPLFGKP